MMSKCEALLSSLKENKTKTADLDRMRQIDAILGFPSRSFRSIHIAGTNGKGSVSTKIASSLSDLGYLTGLFISPHIFTFRERIQINEEMIEEDTAYELFQKLLGINEDLMFFELLTLAAFLYFRDNKVEYAVIETGLGGLFDATNILDPKLSVITSISLDHTEVLGKTIDEIAENKAGIIKPKKPVLLGATAALKPMFTKIFYSMSPLYIMPPIFDWMEENTKIAAKALQILFPQQIINECSKFPPCRFEVKQLSENLTAVFDIAHNEAGLEKLFCRLSRVYPDRNISLIFGTCRDKDLTRSIEIIKQNVSEIHFFESGYPRLLRKMELEEIFDRECERSFDLFVKEAEEKGNILVVTGSAYIMKEVSEKLSAITSLLPQCN